MMLRQADYGFTEDWRQLSRYRLAEAEGIPTEGARCAFFPFALGGVGVLVSDDGLPHPRRPLVLQGCCWRASKGRKAQG